jgi:hypothetical protein
MLMTLQDVERGEHRVLRLGASQRSASCSAYCGVRVIEPNRGMCESGARVANKRTLDVCLVQGPCERDTMFLGRDGGPLRVGEVGD